MTRHSDEIPRIEFGHKRIHEGDAYIYHVTDSSMATSDTIVIAFKTPTSATKYVHMIVEFAAKVAGHLEILEGATWTQGSGAKVVPMNANRNSTSTSSMLENETTTTFTAGGLALGVTTILTTNATTVETIYAFGSVLVRAEVGRSIHEIVLKANTTYVIRFTADADSNAGNIRLHWYEILDDVS